MFGPVALSDEAVLEILNKHSGGRTLPPSQQWVVRAMRALEYHYQCISKDEGVRRYRLEVQVAELNAKLEEKSAEAREAVQTRQDAEADSYAAFEALQAEQQISAALRMHNEALGRERDAMNSELGKEMGELHNHRRDMNAMLFRLESAQAEARAWQDKCEEARREAHDALAEANEARSAAAAMQRSLLSAAEYRMAEEAGYSMQTIIQLAPSKQQVHSLYGSPQDPQASWLRL